MLKTTDAIRLAKIVALGFILAGLSSCQPIAGEDPLDQDAFVTESVQVVPINP